MKKRVILTTIVAAVLVVCMFALTACAGSVEGKNYVFDSIKITDYGDATEEEKKEYDKLIPDEAESRKDYWFEFKADGTAVLHQDEPYTQTYTYVQDGGKITLKQDDKVVQEGKVSGSKIIIITVEEGVTIEETYKLKK